MGGPVDMLGGWFGRREWRTYNGVGVVGDTRHVLIVQVSVVLWSWKSLSWSSLVDGVGLLID